MRLLLAEDDPKIAQYVYAGLTQAGYVVDVAHDGNEALWLVENNRYDAAVMDVMMPGSDGLSVVRAARRNGVTLPIIFASGRSEVRDRVQGLDAGADDYIVKPFSVDELLARLRALLRRQRPELTMVLRVADLEIDVTSRTARRGTRDITLTNREFALLEFLAMASPRVVTKTAIVEHVWDQHFDSGTNVVNVYINYLRRKVDAPGEKVLIHTVRSVGFALREG
jgi:DNA-binding response OmpR family regulator